ncbi:DUF1778 domain-containing protein [Thalassotalea crassostreae]|uniref:type II toxin-antitoxin system TacA family antitoxin n=1 Tax=Thalassotalea crassostreae TaxID=1763536 RepID=UPI000838659B|nr:DUF1778 domain-containing protein [Thalassotalea crassostreae]
MAKTAPINMRVEPAQQDLLTKAAAALNMDRSTFILNVACKEAENVLLDQRIFNLDEEQFAQFEQAINEPVAHYKLSKLMSEKSPWEAK